MARKRRASPRPPNGGLKGKRGFRSIRKGGDPPGEKRPAMGNRLDLSGLEPVQLERLLVDTLLRAVEIRRELKSRRSAKAEDGREAVGRDG